MENGKERDERTVCPNCDGEIQEDGVCCLCRYRKFVQLRVRGKISEDSSVTVKDCEQGPLCVGLDEEGAEYHCPFLQFMQEYAPGFVLISCKPVYNGECES